MAEKKNGIFKKFLILVIVLCSFSLVEKIVDGAFEMERTSMQAQYSGGN